MANRKTALKTQRQDKKRRQRNLRVKRDLKKVIKQFNAYLAANDTTQAKVFLPKLSSNFDKAAKKGIIKKNNAARKKSRFSRLLSKTTTTAS